MLALTFVITFALTPFFVNALNNEPAKNRREAISGKFTPPKAKTLLFIGQDSDTIGDYVQQVPKDKLEGFTLYTMLKSAKPEQTLKGLFRPANWQSGQINYAKTLAMAPNAAIAIGLALDQCNQPLHTKLVANGEYDKSLMTLIDYLKSLAPRKVFLRIGYEFDGPWNCYTPDNYKAAFRSIAGKLKTMQANNVTTVWQSATWPDPTIAAENTPLYDNRLSSHLSSWYPGDNVVDWVSMSVFYRDLSQWHYTPPDTPQAAQQKILAFARAHHKPIMIAEAAPQGYRIAKQTHSFIALNKQTPHSAHQIWQDWYQPFFDFIHQNDDVIRAVAYINTHWESQAMWQCAPNTGPPAKDCPSGNWGDSRVQANAYIKQQWLKEVTNAEQWIQSANY